MAIVKNQLTYRTFSVRDRHRPQETHFGNEVYLFWKNIFSTTFKQVIDPQFILYSDDFLLQDRIGVLQMDDKLIGVIAFTELNTQLQMDFDKSYFKNYPPEILSKLKSNYQKLFVISNLAIDSEYRKTQTKNCYSTYLIGLAIMSFLQSDAEALITITRNNRGTDKIVNMYGGMSLAQHSVHNISSDIMVIEKNIGLATFEKLDDEITAILKKLYNPIYHKNNTQGELHDNTANFN